MPPTSAEPEDPHQVLWAEMGRDSRGRRRSTAAVAIIAVLLLALGAFAVVAIGRNRAARPDASTTVPTAARGSLPALLKPGQLFGELGVERRGAQFLVVLPSCYSGLSTGVSITTSDLDRVLWTAVTPGPISLPSGFNLATVPTGFTPGATLVPGQEPMTALPDEFAVAVGTDHETFLGIVRKGDLETLPEGGVLVNGQTYSSATFASAGHC